jgi:hypothetical protein
VKILEDMSARSALNGEIVSVLRSHYDELDALRMHAQSDARMKYRDVDAARKEER